MLFKVYDQTMLEYMPPKGKKQPSPEERKEFSDLLEGMLKAKGHDRKAMAGYGNYVDHDSLFKPNKLTPGTEKRVWRGDAEAFAAEPRNNRQ